MKRMISAFKFTILSSTRICIVLLIPFILLSRPFMEAFTSNQEIIMAGMLFLRAQFGKSLNMSMLEHFFSIQGDKSIFNGLEISKETALCEEYMGKYPVVSISLKGI